MENVRRTIRRHRAENGDPANPRDRANIPVLPNEFQTTNNDERFLLHDSGVGDPDRIIIFAINQCRSLLEQSDNWFANGTFSVSPVCFYQVCTIHAMALDKVVPCVYALLPNKHTTTYDRLFQEVSNHLNGHVPTDILFDFERAAMNSV